MKKNQKKYVIGIDGGGTKTTAALANLDGKILIKSESGPSNPRNLGIKEAVWNLSLAVNPLLKEIKKGRVLSTFITLPAVEEEYRGKKKDILKFLKAQKGVSKIFKGKVVIDSDQIANFKAGTDEKDGILLIAGTGSVAHGWKQGKDVRAGGWGWLADEGSAFWVGQKTLQMILKDLDKRGPKTLLTKSAFQEFRIKTALGLLKYIYSRNLTETIPRFSIICDRVAQKKDKVARKILVKASRELALSAKIVIKELNFQKVRFPLILAGSIFQSPVVLNIVKKEIKKVAPGVKFIRCQQKPVIGAVKLALKLSKNEGNKD